MRPVTAMTGFCSVLREASTSMSLICCGSVRLRPVMRRHGAANSWSARRCFVKAGDRYEKDPDRRVQEATSWSSAAEKKKAEGRAPACNALKEEGGCEARDDCSWVKAVINEKTGKEKRRAYCWAKPKAPAKKAEKKAA
jgi:hypothetical protein